MKKIIPLLLFAACLLCLGMGSANSDGVVKRIPDPDRNFSVTLVDAADTSFDVEAFSADGLTFVPVEMGRADVALDFAKIEEARFFLQDDTVKAEVTFADGKKSSVGLDPNLDFYGRCQWGNMRLKAKDIRAITFRHAGQ
jgi:hypothetical protein